MVALYINGVHHELDVSPEMPILWAVRDVVGLTGTKFGCGVAACGACTVHLDGQAIRSCVTPVSAAAGRHVTTIEGLAPAGKEHPLQAAWIEDQVPQCGYCQSGQIMSAAALIKKTPNPSDKEIEAAMSGNICRCGCYERINGAIRRAAHETANA
jgi:isoquinoline 1-oxidoreductase alpha subunit